MNPYYNYHNNVLDININIEKKRNSVTRSVSSKLVRNSLFLSSTSGLVLSVTRRRYSSNPSTDKSKTTTRNKTEAVSSEGIPKENQKYKLKLNLISISSHLFYHSIISASKIYFYFYKLTFGKSYHGNVSKYLFRYSVPFIFLVTTF